MTARLSSHDRDLLQRFLDGRTSSEESARCEERLTSDASFREAYEELRALRDLLRASGRIEEDPAFWSRLSVRLSAHEGGERNLLPFPQKYLPLAASAFALLVLLSFSYVFSNRLSFLRFWESSTEAVRSAYESTMAGGGFIPLFAGLDNDKTLQFALYGSLPLDESGGTVLNVDERSAEGYRIEVQKEQPRKQKKVTVADFVAEVRPTNVQKAAIESLLTQSRRELEGAVLVGSNEAVAINADLSRLNRAMASGIVGVLEPEQRIRLKRLLTQEDAAYEYSSRNRLPQSSDGGMRNVRVPRPSNTFVVLSPDSVALRAITLDKELMQRQLKESQDRFREFQAMREKSIQWLVNEAVAAGKGASAGSVEPRIRVRSRKDRLTIHIQADTANVDMYVFQTDDGGVFVRGGDSLSTFEFRFQTDLPPGAEVTAPRIGIVPAPRPDTARPRKPFKLDID